MTSIILAGGKSSRLGWNKAFETINDKVVIQWVVERVASLSTEIIIVTARGDCPSSQKLWEILGNPMASAAMPYPSPLTAKVIGDVYANKGPLGGIYTGLLESSSFQAITVACDMPFLSIPLLEYMVEFSSTFDIVIPRVEDKLEPLCAVYSKSCLASMQRLLEQGELSIRDLFRTAKVKYVEEAEIDRFDPDHLSFLNINTQADLDKARRLAVREKD